MMYRYENKYMLTWTFTNDHMYTKSFEHYHEATDFMITCGLVSHPYIVMVKLNDTYFKGAKNGS